MSETLRIWRKRVGRARRLLHALSPPELVELVRAGSESQLSYTRRVRSLELDSTSRVVFVCHGNIMRSAFAAEYMKQKFPALAERVSSAGTHASPGSAAHPDALKVAAELGVDLSAHGSTPLGDAGIEAADVLIGMDLPNVARCRRTQGAQADRIFLVRDSLLQGSPNPERHTREIHDPYDLGLDVTRRAFGRVAEACDAWGSLLIRTGDLRIGRLGDSVSR